MKSSPILMYHQIVSGYPADIHAVTVASFAQQMQWLSEHGYEGVTVEALCTARDSNLAKPNKRAVAVTFDDGYLDFYTNALPILRQYSFQATVFLVTERIGEVNDWDHAPGLTQSPLMDWEHIHASVERGVSFGAHTCTHPDLTTLSISQAEHEIRDSRNILEQHLQKPIKGFAYPHSRYNNTVLQLVIENGFELACTYMPHYVGGAGKYMYELQRIGILATDNLETFIHKVQAHPQLRFRKFWRDFKQQLKNLGSFGFSSR